MNDLDLKYEERVAWACALAHALWNVVAVLELTRKP